MKMEISDELISRLEPMAKAADMTVEALIDEFVREILPQEEKMFSAWVAAGSPQIPHIGFSKFAYALPTSTRSRVYYAWRWSRRIHSPLVEEQNAPHFINLKKNLTFFIKRYTLEHN